jgi:hypothetical protein
MWLALENLVNVPVVWRGTGWVIRAKEEGEWGPIKNLGGGI